MPLTSNVSDRSAHGRISNSKKAQCNLFGSILLRGLLIEGYGEILKLFLHNISIQRLVGSLSKYCRKGGGNKTAQK